MLNKVQEFDLHDRDSPIRVYNQNAITQEIKPTRMAKIKSGMTTDENMAPYSEYRETTL
jgi:hypothetical protein